MSESAELTIRQELEKAASLIAGARHLMSEGRSIDLSAVEERVRDITIAITAAPPEIGASFKEHLEALIDILDSLQADLDEQQAALKSNLSSMKRREASNAYAPLGNAVSVPAKTDDEADES